MAQYSQIARRLTWSIAGSILGLAVSIGAVMIPILLIFARGFVWPDSQTVQYMAVVLRATVWQALLSTTVVVFVALPVAWAIVRVPGVISSLLLVVVGIPFVIPAPVVATMFATLCARDSWCAQLLALDVPQGLTVVVMVHAWYNTGILVRLLVEAWYIIQGRYTAAAAVLGASAWHRFCTVEWPMLRPAFIAGTLLVFLYCVGSFGVVLLLGGGRVPSLEVEIWRQTSQLLRLDVAAALSMMQLCMSFTLLWLADRFQTRFILERTRVPWHGGGAHSRWVARLIAWIAILCMTAPFVMTVWRLTSVNDWVALVTMLTQPVRGSGIFVSPLAALVRSLSIAVLVAVVSLVLAWIASSASYPVQVLTMIPVGISAVSLGLGYMLWFGRLGLLTAWWVVIVAHVVLALPLVMRQLISARHQLTVRYRWAAATLGASPLRQWYSIDIPLLRRALIAAALFGFAVSLGDFAASLLLTRPDAVTAPVYIARLLGRPGTTTFQLAQLVALLLALVCVVVMLVAEKLRSSADDSARA